jgi:hypothetical protein
MKRLKNPNFYDHGPNGAVQKFWYFIEANFGFDPQTSFHPCELFHHHKNPQKYLMSGSNYFKGRKTAKRCQIL